MIRVYGFLLVFVTTLFSTFNTYAQCTDSVRLAPDSLQWVLGGAAGYANATTMVRYNDTLYIGGHFTYIGKYTGSCIGLDPATLDVINQPGWPKVNGHVNTVIPDGNGGIIIAGHFSMVGDSVRTHVAHINASGSVTAFNPVIDREVLCAVLLNNTLYVAGYFGTISGNSRNYLGAIDFTTGQATSWNPQMVGYVKSMATDGTNLYIGGEFTKVNTVNRRNLASFDIATGTLNSWNPGTGTQPYESVRTMYRQGNTLYVGGDFTQLNGSNRKNIGAFTLPAGTLKGWNPGTDIGVHNIISHNGIVYVAGNFTTLGGNNRRKLAAVDSASGSVTAWNPGVSFWDWVNTMAIHNNTLYAGGHFYEVNGQYRDNFAAIDLSTGNVLSNTANTYYHDSGDILTMCISGGKLYVGGEFASIGGEEREDIAGIDLVNNKIIDFKTDSDIASSRINSIVFDNNKMYVSGYFTNIRNPAVPGPTVSRRDLACFDLSNNYALTSWNPLDTFTSYTAGGITNMVAYGNHIYLAGGIDVKHAAGRYRSLVRVDKSTGAMDTWKPGIITHMDGTEYVSDLLLHGSRLYITGHFGSNTSAVLGGLMYTDLISNARGYGLFNAGVNAVAGHAGKIYVGGQFTGYTSIARNYLAAMDTSANGALTDWNPNGKDAYISALAAYKDRVYIGGYMTTIGGQQRTSFAVADTITGKLWPWKTDFVSFAYSPVNTIYPYGDTVFVGGGFTAVNGKKIWGIARLHLDNFTMPNATINASANPACMGDNITLTATTNVPGASYQWILNGLKVGTNSPTYSYIPANNDKLSVDVKVVTAGCFTSDSVRSNEITMTVSQKATPVITVSGPPTVQPGNTVNLAAVVNNAGSNYSIVWRNKGVMFATTSGTTTSYLKASGTDMITATVIPVGCYDTAISAIHPVQDGVGISHIGLAQTAFIYPNPASNTLHIEGVTQGTLIRLFDVVGKELHNSIADGTTESINIQNLAPGNYLLQLNDGQGERLVKPFIKK